MSTSWTSNPFCAKTWAMPLPMAPAPITPTRLMLSMPPRQNAECQDDNYGIAGEAATANDQGCLSPRTSFNRFFAFSSHQLRESRSRTVVLSFMIPEELYSLPYRWPASWEIAKPRSRPNPTLRSPFHRPSPPEDSRRNVGNDIFQEGVAHQGNSAGHNPRSRRTFWCDGARCRRSCPSVSPSSICSRLHQPPIEELDYLYAEKLLRVV